MASIRKRGDSYQITVTLGRDPSGRRIQETTTFHPTGRTDRQIEKELSQFVREFEEKCQNGNVIQGDKLTFNDMLTEWRESWASEHLTLSVLEGYEDYFTRYAIPRFGSMKMNKITPILLQSIINDLKKTLAPKSIRRIFYQIYPIIFYLDEPLLI